MSVDRERLMRALGGEGLSWLRARLRARLEQGASLQGVLKLAQPTTVEREALERLLGRGMRAEGIAVRLEELEALLREGGLAGDLVEAIETLEGPVRALRLEREATERAWAGLFHSAAEGWARHGARATEWLEGLRQGGLLKRLAAGDVREAGRLLDRALAVADRLPAHGVPLAELAAGTTGDSHALDVGRPLGTLCARLAAKLGGAEGWESAEERRDVWASVGVLSDELSAPVLVLNLRADTEGVTGRLMATHAEAGEPQRLSIRQLLGAQPRFSPELTGSVVHVCENPSVVAMAANVLGASARPMVSTEGQPKTAVRLLLGALVAAGIELRFHVDFDWAGVRIGNLLVRRHGAKPWRMGAEDYRSVRGSVSLGEDSVVAEWEPALTTVMHEVGSAVHEEQVLGALLEDLGRVDGATER
ncbi:TIGR02679 family protein [Myxococcus fulvus]|uniref:TIGR02679 family protein n=1 Tax=Myxococcus fulvus TaxID=33 RepID=UPI003B9C9304